MGALHCNELTAPCDGSINGECFRAHVRQQLLPTLLPGDIMIMDNLGSHKSVAIKAATVKRYHYETHDQFQRHLANFVAAYNFGAG